MTRATMIAGDDEFSFHKIPAFAANNLLLKLQKVALPVMGALFGSANGAKSVLDIDLSEAGAIIAQHVTPELMAEIIMPLFKLAQVASTKHNMKIDSEASFNRVFTVDDLGVFYELVFEVLKHNFGTFFTSLATRFGNSVGTPAQVS